MTRATLPGTVPVREAGFTPSVTSGEFSRWTFVGLAWLASQQCLGASVDSTRPELFAEPFVAAVVSKESQRQFSLVHPLSRACVNEQTRPYFDWIFAKRARLVGGRPVKVTATPIDRVATTLPTDGQSEYPLRPSHQLQLDFESGPHKSSSVIVYVAFDGTRWLEVIPCPRGDVAAQARRNLSTQQQFDRRTESLLDGMPGALRDELLGLLRQGRKVEAITRYAAHTGEDLSVSKSVVERLSGQ